MAPLDGYTIQLKNLHKRYKLSQSVLNLFKALDEHRSGYDPDTLSRLMRMSPGMRKACTDTISQLAKVMQKKKDPSTVTECTELIQNCTEILALASELKPSVALSPTPVRNLSHPSQAQKRRSIIVKLLNSSRISSIPTHRGCFTAANHLIV